ncbi:CapA family protein [Lachnoclostridium sp. Marseille-P6806]|uniref:CapA family protein n=1 Tax=Lachnoclostridium sp. Marseille-P6806 TaxID=2364793 RepID=UPI00102F862A|nr:CapA family protein [Lachnoclostridium sp. Marseille-P6806]
MKFKSRRQTEYYYDEDEDERLPVRERDGHFSSRNRGNASRSSPLRTSGREAAGRRRERNTSRPVQSFFAALALFLGAGFLFLFAGAWIRSADARAGGAGVIPAVIEELIPESVQKAVSGEAGDALPEGEQVAGEDPAAPFVASESISYISPGHYLLRETQAPDLVTFSFAGDILFDERYAPAAFALQNGGDITASFDAASLAVMRTADVMFVNNEFPYSDRGEPTEGKAYTFRASPARARWLSALGVDLTGLANNHAYDYGEAAFLDTLDTLDEAGILRVGGGRNLEEACRPCVFEAGGFRIAVINATQIERLDNPDTRGAGEDTPGVFRCFDDTRLLEVIRRSGEEADFVIVTIHWGTESTHEADWLQTSRIQAMAEAGADLVVGAHPHVLQGIDYAGDMPVVYSLGNYLFSSYTTDTGILQVTFRPSQKRMTQLRFVPMLQSGCRVAALDGGEKARVLEELRSWSPNASVDGDGIITKR